MRFRRPLIRFIEAQRWLYADKSDIKMAAVGSVSWTVWGFPVLWRTYRGDNQDEKKARQHQDMQMRRTLVKCSLSWIHAMMTPVIMQCSKKEKSWQGERQTDRQTDRQREEPNFLVGWMYVCIWLIQLTYRWVRFFSATAYVIACSLACSLAFL